MEAGGGGHHRHRAVTPYLRRGSEQCGRQCRRVRAQRHVLLLPAATTRTARCLTRRLARGLTRYSRGSQTLHQRLNDGVARQLVQALQVHRMPLRLAPVQAGLQHAVQVVRRQLPARGALKRRRQLLIRR